MSIRVLIMMTMVLGINATIAQVKVEVGAKTGLNIAGLALSDGKLVSASYNNRTSVHVGGYALIKLGKLAVQPELLFSKQGQNYSTPNYSNLRTDLTYVNIPFMVKYYVVGGLNVYAGPQLSMLVGAKGDLVQVNANTIGQAVLNQDLKKFMNTTDFGIAFGVGLDVPFGLNLGVRYNLGMSNVNKYKGGSTDTPSFSIAETRNQVLQLSVGYRIKKFGK